MHDVERRYCGKQEISYSMVIKACAEAGDVAKAEHWLCMMLNAGVEANMKSATAL